MSPQSLWNYVRTRTSLGLIVAILLGVTVSGSELLFVDQLDGPAYQLPMDFHKYIYMAEHDPGSLHIAPFCWRIGVPWIVSQLGFTTTNGFLFLNAIFLIVGAAFLYLAVEGLIKSTVPALLSVALYLSSPWVSKMPFQIPWLTDGVFYGLMCIAVWVAVRDNAVVLVILTVVGATVRETAILFPLVFIAIGMIRQRRFGYIAAQAAAALVASGVVMVVIRWFIPSMNHDVAYLKTIPDNLYLLWSVEHVDRVQAALQVPTGLRDIMVATFDYRVRTWSLSTLNGMTIGTWSIIVVACVVVALYRYPRLVLPSILLLAIVYVQLLLGIDIQRLLTAGYPFVLVVGCYAIEYWCRNNAVLTVDIISSYAIGVTIGTIHSDGLHVSIIQEAGILMGAVLLGVLKSCLHQGLDTRHTNGTTSKA